jgi:hypothetical protein
MARFLSILPLAAVSEHMVENVTKSGPFPITTLIPERSGTEKAEGRSDAEIRRASQRRLADATLELDNVIAGQAPVYIRTSDETVGRGVIHLNHRGGAGAAW